MRLATVHLSAALAAALACGCYGTAGVSVTTPDLVYVDPGVQVVVADYDYPVFFSDDVYWRFDGGVWYRSRWHDHGWAQTGQVPQAVRSVPHPEGYAHYSAGARDHRTTPPAPVGNDRRMPAAPAAAVRDHRAPEPVREEPTRARPANPTPTPMGNRVAPRRPAPRKPDSPRTDAR